MGNGNFPPEYESQSYVQADNIVITEVKGLGDKSFEITAPIDSLAQLHRYTTRGDMHLVLGRSPRLILNWAEPGYETTERYFGGDEGYKVLIKGPTHTNICFLFCQKQVCVYLYVGAWHVLQTKYMTRWEKDRLMLMPE